MVAVLPFLALVLWRWNWGPDAGMGDYAQYILHAKAIVAGRSYTDIGYLVHPEVPDIGPRAYPPGLPMALAPVIALAGDSQLALRAFMVVITLAFGWLAYLRLSRGIPREVAAIGVGVTLLAIEVAGGTLAPLSDQLFAVVLWALFVVADTEHRWSWRRTAVVTLLGFALVATRVVGVVIGPALLLFALYGWRRHGTRLLVPLAVWGISAVIALGMIGNPYGGGVVDTALTSPERKLYFFFRAYRYSLFEATLYPFGIKLADQAWHVVATLAVVAGLIPLIRRLGLTLLTCTTAVYLVLLTLIRQTSTRFLWPLQPLLGAALVLGIACVVNWRPTRTGRSAPSQGTRVPAMICGVVMVLALVRTGLAPRPFNIVDTPDARDLYAFLKAETATRPARAIFSNPRVLTLESGVPAMGVPDRTTSGQVMVIDAERITHLVWLADALGRCAQRILNAAVTRYPERFELAHSSATFRVYRVRPATSPFNVPYDRLDWRHRPADCSTTR